MVALLKKSFRGNCLPWLEYFQHSSFVGASNVSFHYKSRFFKGIVPGEPQFPNFPARSGIRSLDTGF